MPSVTSDWDSGEAEADAQPGRAMKGIPPQHFGATLGLGFLHRGESRTRPSTRLGKLLSDTDLLPTGQRLEGGLGHPELAA